jgi:hypothetical protein
MLKASRRRTRARPRKASTRAPVDWLCCVVRTVFVSPRSRAARFVGQARLHPQRSPRQLTLDGLMLRVLSSFQRTELASAVAGLRRPPNLRQGNLTRISCGLPSVNPIFRQAMKSLSSTSDDAPRTRVSQGSTLRGGLPAKRGRPLRSCATGAIPSSSATLPTATQPLVRPDCLYYGSTDPVSSGTPDPLPATCVAGPRPDHRSYGSGPRWSSNTVLQHRESPSTP